MQDPISGFRPVPRTGVIFVTSEAARLGFSPEATDWCNLGQGQPESGALPGAPARIGTVQIHPDSHEYAPVAGVWELREAVANFYNTLYRRGKGSQYSAENVAICGGGRTALTRAAASLGNINLGHFLPDYTAYEELLDLFRTFTAIPILLDAGRGYHFHVDELRREITGRGLGGILLSNPCNPTGHVVQGDELAGWVQTARDLDCAMLFDEFYSNYIWRDDNNTDEAPRTVSAAEYVRDVDKDPVILFNGLTKNWRYPGWRISWTVGPKSVIEAVTSAGSFLDGGGSRPIQMAALPLLDPSLAMQETRALQDAFKKKRALLEDGLQKLCVEVPRAPEGTFYVWGNLASLGGPLSDGMEFFKAALEKKVIVVPGEFFDVNPGKRRRGHNSRFRSYTRFSFGPAYNVIEQALTRLGQVIRG